MRKKIKEMIEDAPSAESARAVLNAMRIFGNVTDKEYEQGRKLIKKEFGK